MPAQVTTRAQVNGYRFLLRRLEHALIRGDSRMIHDPMRGQMRSLIVGLVMGIVITGACGVLAFFKPAPGIGSGKILLSKQGGSLYVRIDGKVHPVLNLASARLIVGKVDDNQSDSAPEQPVTVDDRKLGTEPRGPLVGIVGAPTAIHGGDDMSTSHWTVCDAFTTPDVAAGRAEDGGQKIITTVLGNKPVLAKGIRAASPADMLLVQSGTETFLVYDGVRAKIDTADAITMRALHLEGQQVRDMSPGLLNAFPLVEPIRAVNIDGVGEPSTLRPDIRIGSIITTSDSRGQQLYVVLREGIQPVSAATADIIRYGDLSGAFRETRAVPPVVISMAPVVHTLPVDTYPRESPVIARTDPDRVVCQAWEQDNIAPEAKMTLLIGHLLPIPDSAMPVELASADGNGPGLDQVYFKPGTGEYVEAAGAEKDSRAYGQQFYVSDTGQRYHIKNYATANALGVVGWNDDIKKGQQHPQRAPWPILSLLPPGPELSQEGALIAHDGIAGDPAGKTIPKPSG